MVETGNGKMPAMMVRSTLLIVFALSLAVAPEGQANGRRDATRNDCGMKLDDWCPSYRGDPCNRHKTTAACKADPKCYGMPYRGVSFVPCFLDERGFASNCPTVGCTSRRPPPGSARKPFVCPTC
jgi:hypothetical protein